MAISNNQPAMAALNLPANPQFSTIDIVKYVDDKNGGRLSAHLYDALSSFGKALVKQSEHLKDADGNLLESLISDKQLKKVKTVIDTSLKFVTTAFQSTNGKILQWQTIINDSLDSNSAAFTNFSRNTNENLLKLSVSFNDKLRSKLETAILKYDPSSTLQGIIEPINVAPQKSANVSSSANVPNSKQPMPVSLVGVRPDILNQIRPIKPKVDLVDGISDILSRIQPIKPQADLETRKEQQFEGTGITIRTFGKPAYAQLKGLVGPSQNSPVTKTIAPQTVPRRRTSSKDNSLWDMVFGGLGMAMKGALGTWLLKSAWTSGDAFRTLKKVSGKWLLHPLESFFKPLLTGVAEFGSKMAEKAFGKVGLKTMAGVAAKAGKMLSKAIRFVPLLGTLVNVGFGLQRLQKGDLTGGLLEIGAGLAGLIPVVGTALDWGINAFLLWRDVKNGGVDRIGKKAGSVNWLDKIGKELQKLTLVKGLTLAGKGIQSIYGGSIGKGLADVVLGLGLIGVGSWTSAIEAIGLFSQMGRPDNAIAPITKQRSRRGILDTVLQKFKDTSLYKWLDKFGSAASQIAEGKVFTGIQQIAVLVTQGRNGALAWASAAMSDFSSELQTQSDSFAAGAVSDHKNWITSLVTWFKQTGVGKFITELGEGFSLYNKGDFVGGLRQIASTFGGAFGSAITTLVNWSEVAVSDAVQISGSAFDIKQFRSQLADKMFAMMPDTVRNMFEIDSNGNAKLKSIKQIVDDLLPASVKRAASAAKSAASSIMPSWMSTKPDSANDLIVASSESKPIKLDRDDQLMAGKKGGPLDKLIDRATSNSSGSMQPVVIQLTRTIDDLGKTYKQSTNDMRSMLADTIQQQTILYLSGVQQIANAITAAVGNNGGATNSGDAGGPDQSTWTGPRDPAYIQRINSWNMINPPARMAP